MSKKDEKPMVFDPPGPDAPGYLKRLEHACRFQVFIETKQVDSNTARDIANFLADYVTYPKDREKVIEMLYEASESQFMEMLAAVSGGTANVPPAKDES